MIRTHMLGALAVGLLANSAFAVLPPIAINFDQTAAGAPLTAPPLFFNAQPLRNEYASRGVTVAGPGANDGAAILNQAGNFGVQARSTPNFLAVNDGAGFPVGVPRDPVDFLFQPPISSFSLYVSGGVPASFQVEAFSSAMQSLGAINVASPQGAYAQVLLTPGTPMARVRILGNLTTYVMDDLSFVQVPEPAAGAIAASGLAVVVLLRRRTRSG